MKKFLSMCCVLFPLSALSTPPSIESFIPDTGGLTPYHFDNYSVLFDDEKKEPAVAVSLIRSKLKMNPVFTRSYLSKYNKVDSVEQRRQAAASSMMDFAHLSSVYNTSHSPEQVLQGNADVNRIAMPKSFNRYGLWKLSEDYSYQKSLRFGDIVDLSGVIYRGSERYFYKVLVSRYTHSTIAFLFNANSHSRVLEEHITTVDCINYLSNHNILAQEVFDDIRSDKAYSIDIWALGDGEYERAQCENT